MAQSSTASNPGVAPSIGEPVLLFPSAARTTTVVTDSDWFNFPPHQAIAFELDVTAAATDSGDLLDVEIFSKYGDNEVEIVHFTQVLGNGGAKRFLVKLNANTTEAIYSYAILAAGSVKHMLSQQYMARHTIVDSDADGSFTFSVLAMPI